MVDDEFQYDSSFSSDPIGEHEYPDPPDDEEDDDYTVPCPECGEPVYEDAEQCPYCGSYITSSSHPFEGRPVWWVVLGVIGVIGLVFALCCVW